MVRMSIEYSIRKSKGSEAMDFNKVCPSCLQECTIEPMPAQCPCCGNDFQYENPAYALPTRTILSGKYIVMRVNAETDQEISYTAYDLNLCIPIEIHEFFPRAQVKRTADRRSVAVQEQSQETTYEEAKQTYIENLKSLIKKTHAQGMDNQLREVVQEYNSVYAIFSVPMQKKTRSNPEDNKGKISAPDHKKLPLWAVCAAVAVVCLAVVIIRAVSKKEDGGSIAAFATTETLQTTGTQPEQETANLKSTYSNAYATVVGDEIAVFLSDADTLYFGEIAENGGITQYYPLLDTNDMVQYIATDGEYLYFTVLEDGLYRVNLNQSDGTAQKLVAHDMPYGFQLYGNSIYYLEDDGVHCISKEGKSDHMLVASDADYVLGCAIYQDLICFMVQIGEDVCVRVYNMDGTKTDAEIDFGEECSSLFDIADITYCTIYENYVLLCSDETMYISDIAEGRVYDTGITWSSTRDYAPAFFAADDKVYVSCGEELADIGMFSPDTETVTTISSIPDGIMDIVGYADGKLYVADDSLNYYMTDVLKKQSESLDYNYWDAGETYGE